MSLTERLVASFPVPSQISMPAVGLDVSDHSVKFIELLHTHHGMRVGRFATTEIPAGIIVGGTIARREALIELLSGFREKHKLTFVRASLPEEPGYIFTTQVPAVAPNEIRNLLRFKLEEHVPVSPKEAVLDYDVVLDDKRATLTTPVGQQTVAVSVFPEKLAQDYADLLHDAGLIPVSLEIEAQAIARAVVQKGSTDACMIIDIGRMRSGITVVGGGAVRFTTTVETGGDTLTDLIHRVLPDASPEEVLRIKNEEGLSHTQYPKVKEAMEQFAAILRGHIERYYLYWQTHKDAKDAKIPSQPITKMVFSGGYTNIFGLIEYLSRELRVPAERASVWSNVLKLDEYIPPISYRDSFAYASAIGLALHKDDV